jgi:ATP-dependent Lhr-like helicase
MIKAAMQRFCFHPSVARWFEQTFGSPTEPQQAGWPVIQAGAHTLISAPTGSGKTLAAFFASLDQLFRDGLAGTLRDETRILYVSPLKALSNDIHKNLEQPLHGIRAALQQSEHQDVEVRAEVRTGDTPSAKRQAIARRPPHLLVTTPESFYLLLTSTSGRKLLRTVRSIIVDEIHALVGNRRGAHLAISMERLAALVEHPLQRIGLSATQKPIEEVARFLTGTHGIDAHGQAQCTIIDAGYTRRLDLALELPGSALEAVMSNEVWAEVYGRLAELIEGHRTTLVFANTRRLAERVTHHLAERLGPAAVTSHHGSLSTKLRLEAEQRLKRGELKALVATASLELGIDIGSVDLVCQLGSPRAVSTLLQRVGRAEHRRGGLPKGRLFPLSRDELVECVATLRGLQRGELEAVTVPDKPLDLLAQQIVACAACEDWDEEALFQRIITAYPYRHLTREEFQHVLRMLADGFSTKRGRRGALIHHDAINHRIRGRRGARLVALTSGGAIPDNADYRVIVEPGETFIGTVNEDFAVESMAGEIFLLGNASWRILRIQTGTVRVEDAHGQPPGIPFWLGEAPGRSDEVSRAVAQLRTELEEQLRLASPSEPAVLEARLLPWLQRECALSDSAASQLARYYAAAYQALGALPSQGKLILERFFDESGGMQLVIHSPFGIRLNRAWGLALRKRFCRSFNFELQAAATDDAIVLSLGTQHSFALEEVYRYLHPNSARELLVQAVLDAPMFTIRWRWNASRSLAMPRQRGGRRLPAALQRMEAENLLAAVFPDQLACLENIPGDREVPEHPLVYQTLEDCLTEAMDVAGLLELLRRIEKGEIECLARELPEPSPLAHEILNAKPYAFLDNAPLEERRTRAVYTRRASEAAEGGLGILDQAAIEQVRAEAQPQAANPDELHEALLLLGAMTPAHVEQIHPEAHAWLQSLAAQKRAGLMLSAPGFWVAAERWPMLQTIYPGRHTEPPLLAPPAEQARPWTEEEAARELVRGRIEVCGPITAQTLAEALQLALPAIEGALLALEAEGFVLRGRFQTNAQTLEWCDRRLLARIHRLTLHRLRAEIQPVTIADYLRFLIAWQRADAEHQAEGPEGLASVLEQLSGLELPAAAWEAEVLSLRVKEYSPAWLDSLCFTGRFGWGRLTPPAAQPKARAAAPIRSSPIALFAREQLPHWLALSESGPSFEGSPDTVQVWESLQRSGALFFEEIVRHARLLATRVEEALGELAAQGWVTADSFEGLRAFLVPPEKRATPGVTEHAGSRRHRPITSLAAAGRWVLLRRPTVLPLADATKPNGPAAVAPVRDEAALELLAGVLLRRYGVMFRRLLDAESLRVPWIELVRIYRRWEARGEIRGGHFVRGVGGEQFARPEAIGLLRSIRKLGATGTTLTISGADPLNLTGILTTGPRVAALTSNRILLRDGVPLLALKAGEQVCLNGDPAKIDPNLERALRVGTLPAALRPYYGGR